MNDNPEALARADKINGIVRTEGIEREVAISEVKTSDGPAKSVNEDPEKYASSSSGPPSDIKPDQKISTRNEVVDFLEATHITLPHVTSGS